MNKRNLLGNAWATFEERVLPHDAPEIQRREMRRAFYAGAQSFLTRVLKVLDPGDEPTEEDLAAMDAVAAELNQFAADVQNGKA